MYLFGSVTFSCALPDRLHRLESVKFLNMGCQLLKKVNVTLFK